jgi:hypothetical protein
MADRRRVCRRLHRHRRDRVFRRLRRLMVNIDGLGLTGGAVVFSTRHHRRNALLVRPNASVAHRSKFSHRLAGMGPKAVP